MNKLVLITLASLISFVRLTGKCSEKSLIMYPQTGTKQEEDNHGKFIDEIRNDLQSDQYYAYNGLDSCYTLNPEGNTRNKNYDYMTCCYLEIKYEIISAETKHHAYGCYPVTENQLFSGSFKSSVVEPLKTRIQSKNPEIKIKNIKLKCNSSSFLKVTGLFLLALLF